jgi:TolB-like protein/tetratricopeptide (TPR) repeat protein
MSVASPLAEALHDRYVFERELGRGGMATVYLARDLRHGRSIALKVLHPELAHALGPERFLREIRTTAGLDHPHILPVFDSGEAAGFLWYTMPYVDGETLRSRLSREGQLAVDEAVQLASEIADALHYAHQQGVVHRDIKPENILLARGHARVADFGVARALEAAGTDRLTETGLALGTPAYMSPEQVSGAQVDGRSDQYSLACVLYEMLAGEPPFTGPTPHAIIAKRLAYPPPSLRTVRETVPVWLEQGLVRALSRVPADRFPTAKDFTDALQANRAARRAVHPWRRRVAIGMSGIGAFATALILARGGWVAWRRTHPAPEPPVMTAAPMSVAVLPFRNLGDSNDAYFAEGVNEELNRALVRIQGLAVRPRATVYAEAARAGGVGDLGQRLKATYVIDGSVRRAGRRVRVNVELIQVDAGATTWSHPYDAGNADVFSIQESIASQVASALSVQLTPTARMALARRGTSDVGAYDLYLRARHYAHLETVEAVQRAVTLYNQAIARDSSFGEAWVALAAAYEWLAQLGGQPSAEIEALWRRAVDRAVDLDSLNGEAYAQRAQVRNWFDWDYQGADRDFRRAIALSPGSADAYLNYGQFLNVIGLDDSALAVVRHAVDINPTAAFRVANLVPRLRLVGRLDEAAAEAHRALALDSTLWVAHLMLAQVDQDQGRPADAAIEAERAHRIVGDSPFVLGTLARYYGRAGRRAEAVSILARLRELGRRQYVQRVFLAEAHIGLNDRAGALDALEESAGAREPDLTWKLAYGHFDQLRGEPRYEALLARVGLAGIRSRQ